jgi:predicted RNase H-like nuclease (RuvC/YqgF family)
MPASLVVVSGFVVHSSSRVQVLELNNVSDALKARNEQLEKLQAESADIVQRLEADMGSLSGAYHDLQHACELKDTELEALRMSREREQSAGDGGAASLKELLELRQEMDDLLVCLGQEEQKVEVLSKKLGELGIDAEALVEHIVEEDSGEDEDGVGASPRGVPNVGSWIDGAAQGGGSAVHV